MATVPLVHDDHGEGPAVVLVHGHPFDRSMWRPQRRPLVEAGYRVVAPDLRGYGQSPATPGTVTMGELAGDVAALMERLRLVRPAVVGLSMGGLVAMELAVDGPPLRAVGLVATTAEPVTSTERQQRLAAAAAAEAHGMGPLVELMADRLFSPGCPPQVVDSVTAMMRAGNPVGAAAALRGRAERPDYRSALRSIGIASFVCVGSVDPWSTRAVTDELVSSLVSPTIAVMTGVGHLPNLEAPALFNQHLLGFLAGVGT